MEAYTKRLRWMAPTNCADILLDRAYAEADDHRFELAERRTNLLRGLWDDLRNCWQQPGPG